MISASEHDPFRTPDSRWSRALWLCSEGRYARRAVEDPYVLAAVSFRRHQSRAANHLARERLARRMPGIYFAAEVYHREEDLERWAMEARILTGESETAIARRCRTTPEVVYWYEKLFFDVRPYLHNRDWLVARVLVGESFRRGLQERDMDLLLKLYALVGGPMAVDAVLQLGDSSRPFPRTRDELDAFWGDDHRDTLRRKAAMAARCLPINLSTHQAILEAHHRLVTLERDAGTSGDAAGLLTKNVAAALTSLPFRVAVPDEPVDGSPVSAYDGFAAELRADEVFMAGLGNAPENLSRLANIRFPIRQSEGDGNGGPIGQN